MTNKAKKKPIELWAKRYDSTVDVNELMGFIKEKSTENIEYDSDRKSIFIRKARGDIELKLNNWLLWEINTSRDFWAIDENIFLKTYERVQDSGLGLYRKKQIEIEYCHFKDTDSLTIKSILRFMNIKSETVMERLQEDDFVSDIQDSKIILIETLEGEEKLCLGEYLIKGIEGELYPVSSESFNQVFIKEE